MIHIYTSLKYFKPNEIIIDNEAFFNNLKVSDLTKESLDIMKSIDHATLLDVINDDTDINKYIIISRKPLGIDLSPNYFAELVKQNDMVSLEYAFDIKGWN